jgi:hypothetical protein
MMSAAGPAWMILAAISGALVLLLAVPGGGHTISTQQPDQRLFVVGLAADDAATPTPPAGQPVIALTLQVGGYTRVTNESLLAPYDFMIVNVGETPIDLAHLALQSWYSLDEGRGADDCDAAGYSLGDAVAPKDRVLQPGASLSLDAVASLVRDPNASPQCVDRREGFVLVVVHTEGATYPASSWITSFPVYRGY